MKETKLRTYIYSFFELQRSYKNSMAIFVDIIAVFSAIIMMFVLREHSLVILQDKETYLSVLATIILSVFCFKFFDLYKTILRSISENAILLIFPCTLVTSLIWSFLFSQVQAFDIRATIILWAFLVIFIGFPRMLVRNAIKVLNPVSSKKVIIYGAGQAGRQLASAIKSGPDYKQVAFVDRDHELCGSIIGGLTYKTQLKTG